MKALLSFLGLDAPTSTTGSQLAHARGVPLADTRVVLREREASGSPARVSAAAHKDGPRTAFERYEIKYWVTERVAHALAAFAEPWLQHDTHAASNDQRNVSLYLDTRGFRFFDAHVSSAPDRIKLRVRGYGDRPRGSAFLEVKRKVKSVSLKVRAVVPVENVHDALRGRLEPTLCSAKDRSHLEQFVSSMLLHRAEPKLYVASQREAYAARTGAEDVRMTLDRGIAWQPAAGLDFQPNSRAWRPLAPAGARTWLGESRVLVELKFRGRPPLWVGEAVTRFGLVRESFSKYCTAVSAMRGER